MKTAGKLRKFRQKCEREAGVSADQIEVPLLHLLNDICKLLKVSRRTARKVVGRQGFVSLEDDREWTVSSK